MKQAVLQHSRPKALEIAPSPQDQLEGVFYPEVLNEDDLNIPTTRYPGVERIGGSIVRSTIEVPDVILDPHPAVYAHGYFGFKAAYSKLRNATARNGKVAVTYHPPRTQNILASIDRKHFSPQRLLVQAVIGAMRGTERKLEELGIEYSEFDLSGHSMGGRSATEAALLNKDKVRTVTLNEAAGLEDHDLLMMLSRLPLFMKKELVPAIVKNEFGRERTNDIVRQSAYYMLRNPYRTLLEGIIVANCDIREKVKNLGEFGIKTAILVGQADTLISADRTIAKSQGVADIIASYDALEANHIWPQTHSLETALTHHKILAKLHQDTSQIRLAA